jgi:hypothetical protein
MKCERQRRSHPVTSPGQRLLGGDDCVFVTSTSWSIWYFRMVPLTIRQTASLIRTPAGRQVVATTPLGFLCATARDLGFPHSRFAWVFEISAGSPGGIKGPATKRQGGGSGDER